MSSEIQKSNTLNIVDTLKSIISNIEQTSEYTVVKKNNKLTIKIDAPDGKSRKIFSYEEIGPGVNSSTTINTTKTSIEDRRNTVCNLYKQRRTQTEIASMTMTSQKTISNDIQKLKDQGLIK